MTIETTRVLSGVSFTLTRGRVLAVVGESGAGKTTLARALMRLGPGQASGRVLFGDEDVLGFDGPRLRRYRGGEVALVVQALGDALNPQLKVVDQIADAGGRHPAEARARARVLLARQGLDPAVLERYPRGLSGGEIQRILLAQALAEDPDALILDEPTAALDPQARRVALDILAEAARDRAVLLITHDFNAARALADDVAVLYGGRLIEIGPTREILTRPAHPYARALLRAQPERMSGKDLQGVPGRFERRDQGCVFANRCCQAVDACARTTPAMETARGRPGHGVACHRGGVVTALSAQGLWKTLGGRAVLAGLDLEVLNGETVAICGASGSGKSTLAHLLCGLESPDSGTLTLDDRGAGIEGGGVALVAQHPALALAPHFTVLEAVAEPLLFRSVPAGLRQTRAVEALQAVQLPTDAAFLGRRTHALSGGELQRLAIARALVVSPAVLVADEATSALDVSVQAKILRLFADLQEQKGLAVVFITHDLAVARRIADRMVRFKDGRLEPVPTGPSRSDEEPAPPTGPETVKKMNALPIIEKKIHFLTNVNGAI
ncbi:ABC transporter ATP-binding protein [Pararhodospirillum oryzae]|uniref:ABC transporter ATP-binding protein n=1 Tax=Pararhodospirillum oryzae TaxID=478448 RepID=UPI0011BD8706|nr:oligopeptide/dipeptide ABC transporter ATP-binding protein [Pararhodospirillum oryzae]